MNIETMRSEELPTPSAKEAERARVAAQTAEFLAHGGTIAHIQAGKQTPLMAWTRNGKSIKQGEFTIVGDRPGRGRQALPYQCRDCGDADESKRAQKQRLCLKCAAIRQRPKNAARRARVCS